MEAIESLDTDVSRLITEEDLIDSMFIVCDRNGTGYVHVSSLIDYAEEAMGSANDVRYLSFL